MKMKPIVTVNQCGGLGNQLFQIATCIAYGLRYNLEPKIPPYWSYDATSSGVGRKQSQIVIDTCQSYMLDTTNLPFIIYQEPHWHYKKIPKIEGNVKLDGYFQSEQHFSDYQDVIKNL